MWDVGCWMSDVGCWIADVGLGVKYQIENLSKRNKKQ